MSLIRTATSVLALLAIASAAGAAPISFALDDGEGPSGITVNNNSAILRFETQTAVREDQYPGLPDADGDGVADAFDEAPGDVSLDFEIFDLVFLHDSGVDVDGEFAFAGVQGFGEFASVNMWMQILPDFPFLVSSYVNTFDGANRFGTTDDPWFDAFLFSSDDCACDDPNPWLALGGAPGFIGGLFQTSDSTFHQFWVELIVDVADGTLTLLSAGYETDVFAPVGDPDLDPVPEPATVSLFALGAAGLVVLHRRRRQR